jgi:Zn-dependent protease with chaperone function
MLNASYFDGHSATLRPVELQVREGKLHLAGEAIAKAYRLAELRLAEPFRHTPALVYLPDGGHCEVRGEDAHAVLAEAMGVKPSLSVRWQQRWPAALAALALLLALGGAIWFYVLPAAAEKIAENIPASLDEKIGASALQGLEKHLLLPTHLSAERVATMRAVLADITPAQARHPLRLLVRNAPTLGANALALPDGTIVVTDQLANAIFDSTVLTAGAQKQALAGILAHEIGHVQLRHSVRVLTRSSLTAAGSAALFGDFSAVAAGLPALLSNLHYSRAMETDADSYAIEVLARKGWSTEPLALTFEWLEQVNKTDPGRAMPGWMRQTLPYASSHPGTAERIARLRAVPPPTHPN